MLAVSDWYYGGGSENGCSFGTKGEYFANALPGEIISCPNQSLYKNFTIETVMHIVSGGCGGFNIRNPDKSSIRGYVMTLCNNGGYILSENSTTLEQGTTAINANENTIAFTANGQHLAFYVNSQNIFSLDDNTFSEQGTVGLMAQSEGNQTDVEYTNIKIWTF